MKRKEGTTHRNVRKTNQKNLKKEKVFIGKGCETIEIFRYLYPPVSMSVINEFCNLSFDNFINDADNILLRAQAGFAYSYTNENNVRMSNLYFIVQLIKIILI